MSDPRSDILTVAYVEGVKTALLDSGYSVNVAEKIAAEAVPNSNSTVNVNLQKSPEATRRSILERIMTGAPIGATAGILAGGALGLGRTPAMRRQFMKALRRKKDGGVLPALKELTSKSNNQEQIRSLAIPGAVGGGIIGAVSGT